MPPPGSIDAGQTPLMAAAQYGRATVVKRLMELGADKTAADSRGYRAVDYLMLRNAESREQLSKKEIDALRGLLN